jgi:GT2 family glycosyltransferase
MNFARSARVGIIIPVHNRLSHTKNVLAELRRSEHKEAVVIVVDDGSTDGTGDWLRDNCPEVVILKGSGELWWSGAANLGCTFAVGQGCSILILFNNDNVQISRNCVSELIRCVDAFGGCASAVVLEEAGGAKPHRVRNAGGSVIWPSRGITLREEGAHYQADTGIVECDWLPGMSLAFSADLFARLGGFDQRRFPQYRGDTDFTLRAGMLGKPCVVSYACWVSNDARETGLHFHSRVSPKSFVTGLFSLRSNYQLASTIRFARRYCPPRFVPIHLTLFYMRYVYATLKTWVPAGLRANGAR